MPILISLLRGINVGGNKKIKMADLRDLYASLGFEKTKTLLQSGNAVFQTEMDDLAQIQAHIQDGIQDRFGFDVYVILRTPEEFQAIVDNHPFTEEQINDPRKLSFAYLDEQPDDSAIDDLRDNNPGREAIHAGDRVLYMFYPDGKGRSKLDNNRIERTLKVKATARNWNTTMKIVALLDAFED